MNEYDVAGNNIGKPKSTISAEDMKRDAWRCWHCYSIQRDMKMADPMIHNVNLEGGRAPQIIAGAPVQRSRTLVYSNGCTPNATIGPLCQTCVDLFNVLTGLDDAIETTLGGVSGRRVIVYFRRLHEEWVGSKDKKKDEKK